MALAKPGVRLSTSWWRLEIRPSDGASVVLPASERRPVASRHRGGKRSSGIVGCTTPASLA